MSDTSKLIINKKGCWRRFSKKTHLEKFGVGVLLAVDLGEVGGLAAEVFVAHAQEEVARGFACTVLFL